jgi:hypothetical protein
VDRVEGNVMGIDGRGVCSETGGWQKLLILHQRRIVAFVDSVVGSGSLALIFILLSRKSRLFLV